MHIRWLPAVLFLLLPLHGADAAPVDAKVGHTRATYLKTGTTLRAQPNALGSAVATLPTGTQVRVDEVKLPWLRVTALNGTGTGWLKAFETVEPSALVPNKQAVRIGGGAGVNSRDVTAAGRQLDAGTEAGYRQSRADLRRGYQVVDQIEAATKAMDPAESIAFIVAGRLGRQGRDMARPAMLPPSPRTAGTSRRPQQPTRPKRRGGGLGGLLDKVGGAVGGDVGKVLRSKEFDAASDVLQGMAEKQRQLSEKFTPEQEYYLGRAVAAYAIAKYGIEPNTALRKLVRQVGDAVVRVSSRVPANYGGYHFDVLNTWEINGVSGPGGFVLLTRGAVVACQTEAELAGLICHELAHVTLRHGEKVLRQGKSMQPMLAGLTSGGSKLLGVKGAVQKRLVDFFSKAVGEMSRTAVETGYGRNLEFAADAEGTNLLFDAYYEADALQHYLMRMPAKQHGHAGTHAPPPVRAQALSGVIARWASHPVDAQSIAQRNERFRIRMGR